MSNIDPVLYLRNEFTRRSTTNSRYSLRSFAKSLGISHTVLSLVLSGKRKLSKKACAQITTSLGLGPLEAAAFAGTTPTKNEQIESSYDKISLETFELISDWVHYAILSYLEIPDSKFEAKEIAARFGIGEMNAKVAMDRLVKMGLVEKVKNRWKQSGKSIKVDNSISTAATRNFQKQLLEKAQNSLQSDPVTVRNFSSMTLAVDPSQVAYASTRIQQFRRELTAELESRGRPKEVYNLTVQFYPVSKRRSK